MEDLEDQKRKKKKEKMTLGSLSRVFARGKQRKSLDPGLFDGTATPDYYIEEDADWWCWVCECMCVLSFCRYPLGFNCEWRLWIYLEAKDFEF